MKNIGIILALVFLSSCNAGKYYFYKRISHDENFSVTKKAQATPETELINACKEEYCATQAPTISIEGFSVSKETESNTYALVSTQKTENLTVLSMTSEEEISESIVRKEAEIKAGESEETISDNENTVPQTREKGEYAGIIIAGALLLLWIIVSAVKYGVIVFIVIGYILLAILVLLCFIGLLFAFNVL
jgi:hypothetical protein